MDRALAPRMPRVQHFCVGRATDAIARAGLDYWPSEPSAPTAAATSKAVSLPPKSPPPPPPPSTSREPPPPAIASGSRAASDMLGALGSANLDDTGLGLPVHELAPLDIGPGGVCGALARQDAAAFEAIASRLGRDWWVALDWGGSASEDGTWARVCEEGARAWPHMEPGKIKFGDGSVRSGVSPSGAPRGDRFILAHDEKLGGGDAAWPALRSLHAALESVGEALAAPLLREPRLGMRLVGRTDTLLACFPGKTSPGARYNCHYDGGAGDARKLTAILYPNEGWREEDGGALHMYDGGGFGADGPTERCWRSVQPRAGRLLLFRSDRVLHKVMPAFATRYALTMFHAARFGKERGQANLPPAQQGQGGLGAVQVKDPGVAMQVW